jgi:uncharacterized membrane protein YkvA (DUF1232 family)
VTDKILLLFSAMRDKRTPWYAKAMTGLVLAYIVSPIDIIPDFIPVIGLLDELILVPIAFVIIFKLIPEDVKQGLISESIEEGDRKKLVIIGSLLVITIWIIISYIAYTLL